MRCEELAERVTDLMEGDLGPDDEAEALEHLASCEHCERVLAETQAVVRLTREHGRETVDAADRRRLFDEITTRLTPP